MMHNGYNIDYRIRLFINDCVGEARKEISTEALFIVGPNLWKFHYCLVASFQFCQKIFSKSIIFYFWMEKNLAHDYFLMLFLI